MTRSTLSLVALGCAAFLISAPTTGMAAPKAGVSQAERAGSAATLAQTVDRFLADYWQVSPDAALASGQYDAAARLPVPDAKDRARTLALVDRWLPVFETWQKRPGLSDSDSVDVALLINQLAGMRWAIQDEKSWQWNPSNYNVAFGFSEVLGKDFAPVKKRLALVEQRLKQVPAYYAGAIAQISEPSPLHVRLAINQNKGALKVLAEDLPATLKASGLPAPDKARIQALNAKAQQAIQAYIQRLESIDKEQAASGKGRSFRLGQPLYDAKFRYDIQATVDAKTLHERALAQKAALHERMSGIADQLWPQLFPGQAQPSDRLEKIAKVIDKLSERHVKREQYIDEIKSQIPALVKFVESKDLLEMDPSRPLEVRETPAYMRGVAGASISAPGPMDPKGVTYYNVDPLDDMTPEQAESHLREYNQWVLQVLNIHEAIPGHYVQLLHSNKSDSKVKSLFGNGAMIEGWAVYAERMMIENGWGGGSPEMALMYAKWNLRVVCNAILDYGVHVQGMTEEQALQLLRKEAFQNANEAKEKWHRAQVTSVQLSSYYAGFSEILALRERVKAKEGDRFKLKAFHERFLGYGSAPVAMVSRLMGADAPSAPEAAKPASPASGAR